MKFLLGVAAAFGARAGMHRLLKEKFAADVAKLNAGDHTALLSAYADDFVLHFHDGDHRWAGDWVGKVVEQHDYYLDTNRIIELDRKLDELGVPAIPRG